MSDMSEVRQLSLHPLAIHMFIKAQAGSLGKALSEAVMNSIDAFASSVEIQLTRTGFVIEDNGQGFKDKEEIKAWFETLGFPHDEGNHRVYGKFGLGRAQMWAFAHTLWESYRFKMNVDVKKNGLNYALDESSKELKGTRITGTIYEPLSFQAREAVENELHQLVRYVPGLVVINGKIANKNPALEKWDLETDEAWMRFDKSSNVLAVYNGGVLVNHFQKYRFGCTGVVVTKPEATLSLNIARNEILEADCLVWPKILKCLPKAESSEKKVKTAKRSKSELNELVKKVQEGSLPLREALSSAPELVTSVYGRSLKFQDLVNPWSPRTVVFVPKGSEFGKRLSKLNRAAVVDIAVLDRMGCSDVAEFKALVRKSMDTTRGERASHDLSKRQLKNLDDAVWTADPEEHFPDLVDGKLVFATSELTNEEKAVVIAWTRTRNVLMTALRTVADESLFNIAARTHSISLGDSATQTSWLDGSTQDWILRKKDVVDAMPKSLPLMMQFALARVREFCCFITTGETEGNTLFSRMVCETDFVGSFMLNLTRYYVSECRNKDVTASKTRLADFEALNVE